MTYLVIPLKVAFFLALLAALTPSDADAQRRSRRGNSVFSGPIEAGLRGGRDFGNDTWTLGGQLRLPVRQRLELRPSGDLLFPEDAGTGWQLNGDAAIRFGS